MIQQFSFFKKMRMVQELWIKNNNYQIDIFKKYKGNKRNNLKLRGNGLCF